MESERIEAQSTETMPPIGALPPDDGVPEVGEDHIPTFAENLAMLIEVDALYRAHDKAAKVAKEKLDMLKVICLDGFEKMEVNQMKIKGRTVFIAHQFWAGNAEGTETNAIVNELKDLGLEEYVSYNHQSFSSYVRETAKSHPELVNNMGELIATPEEIIAVLPGKLGELCKVTDKIDLKIRKG